MKRKEFISKACLSGACMCGFGSLLSAGSGSAGMNQSGTVNSDRQAMLQAWIAQLLENMGNSLDEESIRKIIKNCSEVHYNDLGMDSILAGYSGNLEAFMKFLEVEWGWKITWDAAARTLIADENKDYCVCPLINQEKGLKSPVLCYCSEGFAEKMFGAVTGESVTATVVSSVQRGDKSCRYKVTFK
jgi:hypothetical protein